VHTSADPSLLAATLRATWPDGTCTDTDTDTDTDTGVYYMGAVELPLLEIYTSGVHLVTGRVNARAAIPAIIELFGSGCELAPAVHSVVPWEEAPAVWPTMTHKTVFTRTNG
jgi:hypothetical protein